MDVFGLIFVGFLVGFGAIVAVVSLKVVMIEIRWQVHGTFHPTAKEVDEMHHRLRKSLTERSVYLLPWTMCLLVGVLMAFGIWLIMGFGPTAAWIELGYVVTIVIGGVLAHRWYAPEWELAEKRLAAAAIFRYMPIAEQVDLLLEAATSREPHARLVAVESFKKLVNEEIYAQLIQLQDDPFHAVSLIAQALVVEMKPLMDHEPPMSVVGLKLLATIPRHETITFADALNSRTTQLNLKAASKILFSQFLHRQSYPHVYCVACNAWADKIGFKDVAWLQCKVCKDAPNLIYPVHKVVGQIGGEATTHLEYGRLTVNLWDAATATAIPAQIDELEIIGGQEIDYNWAVSAVLGELRNPHLPDNRPYEISLVNHPPLDLNTIRLLQQS